MNWCSFLMLFLMTAITAVAKPQKVSYSLEVLRQTEITSAEGDMNHDGLADLAIIAIPDSASCQPVLAIWWGTAGGFECYGQYDTVFSPEDNECISYDYGMKISEKGVLTISLSTMAKMGGWSVNSYSYVLRFQKGDFFLIGMDNDSFARNTGNAEAESYNFLTYKKQRRTYNMFDETVKPKETWSRLPKTPLKRLDEVTIGD